VLIQPFVQRIQIGKQIDRLLCKGEWEWGPELTSHSVSGYSEGVEVNLAGWDGTLRRGKRKERSENPIIKERKKEENTERKKWKNQRGEVKRD